MNDNELKQAFSVLAKNVDPEKIVKAVRAETERSSLRLPGTEKEAGRMKSHRRGLIALCAAAAVVLTSAVAAVPLFRNTLNARSVQEAARLTEVPEGWTGIYTIEDLDAVRNDLKGYYILMEDLAFAPEDFREGGRFAGGWEPVGTHYEPFEGIFDGNGHTVGGLTVNVEADELRTACAAGLFGYVRSAHDLEVIHEGEPIYTEYELDINGDGILETVTDVTYEGIERLDFRNWGISGTVKNLRLTGADITVRAPSGDASGDVWAGAVAGFADYVFGCSVENCSVTLLAGDAEAVESGASIGLNLYLGGVSGESYLIDSCRCFADLTLETPGDIPENLAVHAGGICGLTTASVTSYFDCTVRTSLGDPGAGSVRENDVPRFLPEDVIDEIMIRLLFVGVDPSGTMLIRADNYEELTETVRKWGVTAENLHEYSEDIRNLTGNGRFDGFEAHKFLAFYRTDDPYYSDVSPDAIQNHYTADADEERFYMLDPSVKKRELRELSRLISYAFPDGDFEDFCRENGVKYGMYYVYDLGDDPECSFEGFDFDSVWTWEGELPVLRIFG